MGSQAHKSVKSDKQVERVLTSKDVIPAKKDDLNAKGLTKDAQKKNETAKIVTKIKTKKPVNTKTNY